MSTQTYYVVNCNIHGGQGHPPHAFLILKSTADSLLAGTQGYIICPDCNSRVPSATVTANTLVTTT